MRGRCSARYQGRMKLKALKIFGWCGTGSGAARQPRVSTSTPGTWCRVHGIEVPPVHGVVHGVEVPQLHGAEPPATGGGAVSEVVWG